MLCLTLIALIYGASYIDASVIYPSLQPPISPDLIDLAESNGGFAQVFTTLEEITGPMIEGMPMGHHDMGHHDMDSMYERSPLVCSCPDGFVLNGRRCERLVKFPPKKKCPSGFESTHEGGCIRKTEPELHCPYGFAKVHHECIKHEHTLPRSQCPKGYELQNISTMEPSKKDKHGVVDQKVCVRKVRVPLKEVCPDGSKTHGSCTIEEVFPAEHVCEPGFTPHEKNTCVKKEKVQCGEVKSKGKHTTHLRKLTDEEEPEDFDEEYMVEDEVEGFDGTGVQPEKANWGWGDNKGGSKDVHWKSWKGDKDKHKEVKSFIHVETSCFAEVIVPAKPFCRVGVLHGNHCHKQIPISPVKICPAQGTVHDCFDFERIPPEQVCPHGFVEECVIGKKGSHDNIECKCARTLHAEIEAVCPVGFEMKHGKCIQFTRPVKKCPHDTEMIDGVCVSREFADCSCTYTITIPCSGPECPHKDHKDKYPKPKNPKGKW